jgi:hypothetical protein
MHLHLVRLLVAVLLLSCSSARHFDTLEYSLPLHNEDEITVITESYIKSSAFRTFYQVFLAHLQTIWTRRCLQERCLNREGKIVLREEPQEVLMFHQGTGQTKTERMFMGHYSLNLPPDRISALSRRVALQAALALARSE